MVKRNRISYKDIKLTAHAKQRAEERYNITSSDEIRKMAVTARYNGINVSGLIINRNPEHFNLDMNTYNQLKRRFSFRTNSERIYYYKNKVFIFCGNDAKTLKTIITVDDSTYKEVEA